MKEKELKEVAGSKLNKTSKSTSDNSSSKICKKLYTIRSEGRGVKKVICAWQESAGSLLAVSVEGHFLVTIYNRQGGVEQEIPIQGNCSVLEWDSDGDFLAIVSESTHSILLWEAHSKKLILIDTSIRDAGICLSWSKTGKQFAYGTAHGNLLVYNHRTLRKVPIIGKHPKEISCCAWSNENTLALATSNNLLSLNTQDGDVVKTVQLRGKPHDLKFGHFKGEHGSDGIDNTVSLIVAEKTLYLLRLENTNVNTPLELGFQQRYGNLLQHAWLGDGYILASFSSGFLVTISTHHKEIGTEIILVELPKEPLRWTHLSRKTGQICVCFGDISVEVRSAQEPNHIKSIVDIGDEGRLRTVSSCSFSDDGQLLSVVSDTGDIHVFLTSVPLLGASSSSYLIQMSSLTEAGLHFLSGVDNVTLCAGVCFEIEPVHIFIGPEHFGASLNNRIWYYAISDFTISPPTQQPIIVKDYNANVEAAVMNGSYAAVLSGDRLCLHLIDPEGGTEEREIKIFQEVQSKRKNRITCIAISKDFLFFGTEQGTLRLFHLEKWEEISAVTVKAKSAIRSIFPDLAGLRLIIITKEGLGFLYDMRYDSVEQIIEFPSRVEIVLWDYSESSAHLLITFIPGQSTIDIFRLSQDTLSHSELFPIGSVRLFGTLDQTPLLLRNGIVYTQTSSGRLGRTISLYTERPEFNSPQGGKREKLEWLCKLCKFKEAYEMCRDEKLGKGSWLKLAQAALEAQALSYAKRAFCHAGNYGAAYNLSEFLTEDDLRLQQGHILALRGKFDEAEKLFLKSSDKSAALRMRYDLRHWEDAYNLATELSTHECAEIALRLAEQDELNKNYSRALESYSNAATYAQMYEYEKEFSEARVGMARNCFRCGQVKRGEELLASTTTSIQTQIQCAEILEANKFLTEAAILYEKAQKLDKAATLYIRTKSWEKIEKILPGVSSKKILLQYAKSREAEGNYDQAAESYERGGDVLNAVRLLLKNDKIEDGISLVKKTGSREGGTLIASYLAQTSDIKSGLRFLLTSHLFDDAVALSFQHGVYDLFATICSEFILKEVEGSIAPAGIVTGYFKIAQFYEGLKDYFRAGKFYYLAGEVDKAFKNLLKAGTSGMIANEEEFYDLIINTALELTNENENEGSSINYSAQLVAFLLGDKDGVPKDLKYVLKFYSLSKKTSETVKTCLLYSSDELVSGNFRVAHQSFVSSILNLRGDKNRQIPYALYNAFKPLHFYYIAKLQATGERHGESARLLQKVYTQFNSFPKHAVEMLTLTVVECSRGGLKGTSVDACMTLMKSEYRAELNEEYRKKFELLMRRSASKESEIEDNVDELSPCTVCDAPLFNYDLFCTNCNEEIPFCAFSGRHLVAEDFSYTPCCQFPTLYSEVVKLSYSLLKKGKEVQCPVCRSEKLGIEAYKRHFFVDEFLEGKWIGPR